MTLDDLRAMGIIVMTYGLDEDGKPIDEEKEA
jgi:hypothetical protein